MNTNECRMYIVGKYGRETARMFREAADESQADTTAYKRYRSLERDALDPIKWKRVSKVKIGSKADKAGRSLDLVFPEHMGCIAREFILEDSDGVAWVVIEKDGAIIDDYDVCD